MFSDRHPLLTSSKAYGGRENQLHIPESQEVSFQVQNLNRLLLLGCLNAVTEGAGACVRGRGEKLLNTRLPRWGGSSSLGGSALVGGKGSASSPLLRAPSSSLSPTFQSVQHCAGHVLDPQEVLVEWLREGLDER